VFQCKQTTGTPVTHAIQEFLWVSHHQGCQSWCLLCKKVRRFYRLPGVLIPADPEIAQISSCHALPSILVLVLIPLDRNESTRASKLLWGGYFLMSIVLRQVSVSLLNFTRAPWLLTGAEITLTASSDMGEWKLNVDAHQLADLRHSHFYL